MVLSHSLWTLATFPLFLCPQLLDQQKLTGAQNGPVEFGRKNIPYGEKKTFSLRNDNFVSREHQRTSTKIGKSFTLYHPELMKKRLILCTLCRQSVIRGLTRLFELPSPFRIIRQTLAFFVPQPCVCVCVCFPIRAKKSDFCSILINILCVNVCGLLHSRSYGKNQVHAPLMV